MVGQDDLIRREVLRAALELGEETVGCSVEDGIVYLDGAVVTDEDSYHLEEAARSIDGVRSVHNNLVVGGFAAVVDDVAEGVDLMPDFTAEVGTVNALEAVSEAEPYVPPTDPVVKPDNSPVGLELLGGFPEAAEAESAAPELPAQPPSDDELRQGVLAALHADAATTDLAIDVEVRDRTAYLRGTVPSLDDVDSVESVASQVPGLDEVLEELDVEGL